MFYAEEERGRRGDEGAAGLDDELGSRLAEIVLHGRGDGVEIDTHRGGFTGGVGRGIAAADVETLELDAGLFGNLGGCRDVALIGVGVFALAADVEAERGRKAHL